VSDSLTEHPEHPFSSFVVFFAQRLRRQLFQAMTRGQALSRGSSTLPVL